VIGLAREAFDSAFDYQDIRNMEIKTASERLAALGHETRLAIFRLLVQAGPQGVNARLIGEKLQSPATTLSFHLAHLSRVGLITGCQESRFIFYAAHYAAMDALIAYLTDKCCQGGECLPRTSDIAHIAAMGGMSTPGVAIDGQVVHSGGMSERAKGESWI
jgi:ArsR family transcriptional regulator, arsenate/arsenite/antimonite-responsive transcriptional repressor